MWREGRRKGEGDEYLLPFCQQDPVVGTSSGELSAVIALPEPRSSLGLICSSQLFKRISFLIQKTLPRPAAIACLSSSQW